MLLAMVVAVAPAAVGVISSQDIMAPGRAVTEVLMAEAEASGRLVAATLSPAVTEVLMAEAEAVVITTPVARAARMVEMAHLALNPQ